MIFFKPIGELRSQSNQLVQNTRKGKYLSEKKRCDYSLTWGRCHWMDICEKSSARILNAILASQTEHYIKRIITHNQVVFMLGMLI